MMLKTNKRGFTLIELLVVIAIIGLLATIVLVSLNNARNKANNAKIKSDLSQMMLAVEMYYSDNSTYPLNGASCGVAGTGVVNTIASGGAVCSGRPLFDTNTTHIQNLPTRPGSGTYAYSVSGATSYSLSTTLFAPQAGVTWTCSNGACY